MHAASLTACEMKIETKVLEAENWEDLMFRVGKGEMKLNSEKM